MIFVDLPSEDLSQWQIAVGYDSSAESQFHAFIQTSLHTPYLLNIFLPCPVLYLFVIANHKEW